MVLTRKRRETPTHDLDIEWHAHRGDRGIGRHRCERHRPVSYTHLVRWAKQNGIGVGPGRGSAAGALVAYAMDITTFDPLSNGLMFEKMCIRDRISTIHGMCSRILRAHALELGLDPEFSVLDESVSGPVSYTHLRDEADALAVSLACILKALLAGDSAHVALLEQSAEGQQGCLLYTSSVSIRVPSMSKMTACICGSFREIVWAAWYQDGVRSTFCLLYTSRCV